jgi:hypothetical protein
MQYMLRWPTQWSTQLLSWYLRYRSYPGKSTPASRGNFGECFGGVHIAQGQPWRETYLMGRKVFEQGYLSHEIVACIARLSWQIG